MEKGELLRLGIVEGETAWSGVTVTVEVRLAYRSIDGKINTIWVRLNDDYFGRDPFFPEETHDVLFNRGTILSIKALHKGLTIDDVANGYLGCEVAVPGQSYIYSAVGCLMPEKHV